ETLAILRETRATAIVVTHDAEEAMRMGDRIALLDKGEIVQAGTAQEIYHAPRNIFVAGFIGSPTMNFLTGEEAAKRGAHTVGIRPEHVSISTSDGAWKGTVGVSEHLGSDTFLHVHREAGGPAMTVRVDGEFAARHGDTVWLTPQEEHIHKFDAEGLRIA
ncbi:TOBE domain-containing protein, partial [Nioella sp.]|uniref:TOBE domain-containing protein n=1 Tax=Nioella sp. TaxID=1912091 RepID=UPI003511DDDF